ncbi:hypothetical protein C0993_000118 [Termitomyces sp. T159_Od127]|nr:hypothetical protein C0993_000118 [Termitomyces sp. T159_Od127]
MEREPPVGINKKGCPPFKTEGADRAIFLAEPCQFPTQKIEPTCNEESMRIQMKTSQAFHPPTAEVPARQGIGREFGVGQELEDGGE